MNTNENMVGVELDQLFGGDGHFMIRVRESIIEARGEDGDRDGITCAIPGL